MASTRTVPPGRSLRVCTRSRIAYKQILDPTTQPSPIAMAPVLAVLLSTLVAGATALPTTRESPSRQRYDTVPITRDYLCFDGTDATADATQWLPFNQLWSLNEPTILSKNGGDTYITHYIREAIEQVSCDGEVDASLVLAIVMQEVSQARDV
ncbi:hypothetical protein LTR27_002521 [Elasticomyces elasticus]|nr:hypothetical protein LTR27_002521 [Elasticomyces elasticus]